MATSIEVFGRRNSANVQKVMWVLGELGLAYKRHDVAGSFGVPPGYSELNPNPIVPTIRDGDLTLWESNACVRYLSREYGGLESLGADTDRPMLWPQDRNTLAHADQWMEWQRSDLSNGFFPMFMNMIRTPQDKANVKAIERGVQGCNRAFTQLDAHLAHHSYVAGEQFTMGDIPLGPMVYRYLAMQIDRPELPNLKAWYHRLSQRPAYQRHVMIPFGNNLAEWDELERGGADVQ